MKRCLAFFILLLLPVASFGQTGTPQALDRPAAPETVGLSGDRLDRISPLMQQYVDEGKLSGVVTLVARRGQIVHLDQYGVRNVESGAPMEPTTLFRIYSMTKPVTSVAVLMLYEEGRFHLDDPIARYIPSFEGVQVYDAAAPDGSGRVPADRPVTIRDLLTHTSGLTYGFFSNTPVDSLYRASGLLSEDVTLAEAIDKLGTLPLLFQPGTRWHYSFSTDVLGRLVEVVSGQTLAEFFQARIFDPLGMDDTSFEIQPEELDRLAVNYEVGEDGRLVARDGGSQSTYVAPVRFLSGGGGLVSTPLDYYRFAQMLLNGGELDGTRLLGSKTVELMTMNHLEGEQAPGQGFGLGVQVTTDVARTQQLGSEGTFGWSGMANTYFFVDPQEELIGMVWTQLVPFGYYPLYDAFHTAVYQAIVD